MHQKIAHQAVLEWALAMSSLQLPPYIVEHIFNSLQGNSTEESYALRKALHFLWIPAHSEKLNFNYVHLIIAERTHLANIQMFISIHKAFQQKKNGEMK